MTVFKRRWFLAGGLAGVAALAGITAWRVKRGRAEEGVIEVLYKRLDYLRLDAAGVNEFARDVVAGNLIDPARLHFLAALGPVYKAFAFSGRGALDSRIRHGEDRVVTLYLLSSDFFTSGADMTRVVRYLGRRDPLRGCASPFARPPNSDGSAQT